MTTWDFGSRARLADLGRAGFLVVVLLGPAQGAPERAPETTEAPAPGPTGGASSAPPSRPPPPAGEGEPRKSFTPSEKLPADASVSFPVDI